MNRQKVDFTANDSVKLMREYFPTESEHIYPYCLEYWAYPEVFSNTAGPFSKPGMISGQAMTTFTIEAWVCGTLAVLFCKNKVVKVTNEWRGPQSVRIK